MVRCAPGGGEGGKDRRAEGQLEIRREEGAEGRRECENARRREAAKQRSGDGEICGQLAILNDEK